ncbi:GH3 auxin-responsive promoter [Pisolithus microcarpus]|nr:GH3 auxin-responsive promoter [Pisolithus microcarpus]
MSLLPTVYPLSTLSPELKAALQERTERCLMDIVGTNITTHYGISAPSLSLFRQAIAGKDVQEDPTVIIDFRQAVPLTDYGCYSPFIANFFRRPCKQSELENLLAPGLPVFVAKSSSTTGNKPKLFPKYPRQRPTTPPGFSKLVHLTSPGKAVHMFSLALRDVLDIMGDDGEVVKKIPVCFGSSGAVRSVENWSVETDNTRMGTTMPGCVSPWATGFITHYRSFLLIHALFALSDPTVERFLMTFITFFVDLIRYVHENWDLLITSIRDGTIPDIGHIEHVRKYLQANFRANPERAEELQNIGPPLDCPGWAQRVWPNLKNISCVCSSTFATLISKARSVLGPNVLIHNLGYGCTECPIGKMLNVDDTETFVLETGDYIEYLDPSGAPVHENILQAWDLEPGKCYQPVVTTEGGLWRYLIDDVIQVTGFDPRDGLPVFKFRGRKSMALRLPIDEVTEAHLVSVIRALSTEDIAEVLEFTAVADARELPQTVGFFIEIIGDIGRGATAARQKAFEALVRANEDHQRSFDAGQLRLPTIRVVKPGTFAEYRLWRGESTNAGVGQIKVPAVMLNEDQQEWIAERVIAEL